MIFYRLEEKLMWQVMLVLSCGASEHLVGALGDLNK